MLTTKNKKMASIYFFRIWDKDE